MRDSTILACSRRSDSGERCEVKKEREKNKSGPPLLFIAFFTSHRSPLSERLEQASTILRYCAVNINRPPDERCIKVTFF